MLTCFVKKVNYIYNTKSSWFNLFSTGRSTVLSLSLSLLLQLGFSVTKASVVFYVCFDKTKVVVLKLYSTSPQMKPMVVGHSVFAQEEFIAH
jgi:hypothetical protein